MNLKHYKCNNTLFRSPKRNTRIDKELYSYYAGYSDAFVEDILDYLQLEKGSIILDPWNGSGTTTYVSQKKGYKAIGYDINPVMPIIASARHVSSISNIKKYYQAIINLTKRYKSSTVLADDPLKFWLCDNSIVLLRRIERAIQFVFLSRKSFLYAKHGKIYNKILSNPELSFFYVNLFRTVKELLSSFKSSNPTWVKTPREEHDKLNLDEKLIMDCFKKNLNLMIQAIKMGEGVDINNQVTLGVASSQNLPLKDSFVDAVITSPPYCTRIDYAITTRLELAILGYGYDEEFEDLRSQMIGTIKILEDYIETNDLWGETALKFLESVRNHKSKASKTYYLKQYLQYFQSVYNSLSNINWALKKQGYTVIVVQDSYYKDVHLDLPRIFVEMALSFGWELAHCEAFYQQQTFAVINQRKKKYRSTSSAVEKVLIFKKED